MSSPTKLRRADKENAVFPAEHNNKTSLMKL